MRKAQAAALAALCLAAATAQAQLFKCVQGGRTVYQDSPCDDAARQSTLRAPASAPVAPPAAPADGKAAAAPAAPASPGGNATDMVARYTICAERVPNFLNKYGEWYDGWKARNAAALSRLSSEPEASQLDAKLREERARPASESIAERCADVATQLQPPRDAGAPRVVK